MSRRLGLVDQTGPLFTKKRGRPPKPKVGIEIDSTEKRKPGRPKKFKEVTDTIPIEIKRKRGRPKKAKVLVDSTDLNQLKGNETPNENLKNVNEA